jgi:hypothetical protein
MRKISILLAAVLAFSSVRADEGMWMLPTLKKMNQADMKKLGLKIKASDIYNENKASIKDAVVHFGGGCTAEIISEKGLLVTNHHCGYSSIQGLSTPEHNYLEDGYWAMSLEEEIPVPGLTVTFLQSMTDITGMDPDKVGELYQRLTDENPGCQLQTTDFYNGNQRYIIVNKVYRDVRFVGAPPASAGNARIPSISLVSRATRWKRYSFRSTTVSLRGCTRKRCGRRSVLRLCRGRFSSWSSSSGWRWCRARRR